MRYLRAAKVDGAGVVLVHCGDALHLLGCEREVEDVEVRRHALFVRRLGDGHDAALREPSQCHLRGAFAVHLPYLGEQGAFHDAVHALSAQRSPCHHPRAGFGQQRLDGRSRRTVRPENSTRLWRALFRPCKPSPWPSMSRTRRRRPGG